MKILCLSGLILALALSAAAQIQPATQTPVPGAQAAPTQLAPEVAAQQVGSLLQQLDQAAIGGNTAFLQQVLADDYLAINPQGKRQDKNYVLQREADMKYDSIDIVQGPFFQNQGNRVVETNVANVRGSYKGQRFDGTYQSSRVWQLRDGQWKIVSLQVNQLH